MKRLVMTFSVLCLLASPALSLEPEADAVDILIRKTEELKVEWSILHKQTKRFLPGESPAVFGKARTSKLPLVGRGRKWVRKAVSAVELVQFDSLARGECDG